MTTAKIIFVGLHNKAGRMALCSSTKSGKLIDRIIKEGGLWNWRKTNLFDVDYYPVNQNENFALATIWFSRIEVNENDLIVLLGAAVHRDFVNCSLHDKILKVAHPASKRSHKEMDDYVVDTVKKITLKNQKIYE